MESAAVRQRDDERGASALWQYGNAHAGKGVFPSPGISEVACPLNLA